jgi:predicted nucleic acid-binding protein
MTAELACCRSNSQSQEPALSVGSGRLCTDAYLAALAIANGWRLVSFDRDFERFESLERLALR